MNPEKHLSKKLHYQFNEPELLQAALTHRSVGAKNNERLEFLGDSVLNFIVAAEIYNLKPSYQEGQLTRLRASLVREETLADIARELELGDLLKLGSGELKSGGYKRASILSDAVEALIGAVYLDGGFESAKITVHHLYKDRFENLPDSDPVKDPKTTLQEYLQGQGLALPEYQLLETLGVEHSRTFVVGCEIESLSIKVQSKGTSRRKAEQAAAADALSLIES